MEGEDGEGGGSEPAHEASSTTMAIIDAKRIETIFAIQGNVMTLLLLEALGAMLLLIFIVWWTMFSGRKKGELKNDSSPIVPVLPNLPNLPSALTENDKNKDKNKK